MDDGKTWACVRDIERGREGYGAAESGPKTPGREEYSYPAVTQTPDGQIHVAFTYRRRWAWKRHGCSASSRRVCRKRLRSVDRGTAFA